MSIERIKEYVAEWNKMDGVKPCNDPQFISDFIEFCKNSEKDQWGFSGENGYCGNTATISEFDRCGFSSGLEFEFAFGSNFVKVFTANHHGFWVPEYICFSNDQAKELLDIIKTKALEWAGF